MLKFFFYRSSKLVYLMNLLTFLEISWIVYARAHPNRAITLGIGCLFLMCAWLLINLMNWIPWYPKYPGKLGIRLHFQKSVVPMAYLLPVAFLFKIWDLSEWYLLPFVIMMLPILYVNAILLYFHFKDPSDMIPGYFSHNFYLQNKEPTCTR